MSIESRSGKIILLMGDFVVLYASLFLALIARDMAFPSSQLLSAHLFPFFIINLSWIFTFYVAGFYDSPRRSSIYLDSVAKTILSGIIVAALFFYFFPTFGITPKTILAIDAIIASVLIWQWRLFFIKTLSSGEKIKIFFFEKEQSRELSNFKRFILDNPHFGYEQARSFDDANIIAIVPHQIQHEPEAAEKLYYSILKGKTVIAFDKLYESLTGKIPVSLISEMWFFENLRELNKQTFERFKRGTDVTLAILCLIPLIIIFPFVAIVIKLTSKGKIFYKQKRIGKNGKIFEIIKFRSMKENSEQEGAGWHKPNGKDKRVTLVGNFLRKTRIDELPQIFNVLDGDMSFVGPRPERPEFVQELIKTTTHYSMRHLVKPGLTGWAQINFSDASAKDAPEKLQYDLFYIKNRSIALDFTIILKTIAVLLSKGGK